MASALNLSCAGLCPFWNGNHSHVFGNLGPFKRAASLHSCVRLGGLATDRGTVLHATYVVRCLYPTGRLQRAACNVAKRQLLACLDCCTLVLATVQLYTPAVMELTLCLTPIKLHGQSAPQRFSLFSVN